MIQKHKQSNQSLKNKIIIAGIALSIIIGLIIFITIKSYESSIQRKLIGSWNIEFENSYIERDSIYEFSWSPMNIKEGSIKLPRIREIPDIDFHGIFDDEEMVEKWSTHIDKVNKKSTGTWKIINTNPDSVFFDAPKHPLHGRYAVRFFIDRNGWVYANMRNNIYKIELTNDSTYLICNKGSVMFTKDVRDWEN